MCHFLKPGTQEPSQKMSYSSELWHGSCFYDVYYGTAKKHGETAATAENHHLPPNLFQPFLAEIYIFGHLRPDVFFSKKITLTFLHLTLVIFQTFYQVLNQKTSLQCKCWGEFFGDKKLSSNDSGLYNSARIG